MQLKESKQHNCSMSFCCKTFDFVGLQIQWKCFKNKICNWKTCTYSNAAKICDPRSPAYHFYKTLRTTVPMLGFLPVPKPLENCREQSPKIVWSSVFLSC